MGFGYLLMGYLVTFLLQILARALGVGALALLLGYGMMWVGLRHLKLFCRSFAYAEWTLYAMLGIAFYRLFEDFANWFLWDVKFISSAEVTMAWIEFFLMMVFHAALLSALREIGMQVGLEKIATAAIRNLIIVFLYAAVYVIYLLPTTFFEAAKGYLTFSISILNLAWILCNLFLLLNCTKDIVAEGQEDPEPKKYRWEFLNRVGNQFEENFKKAADSNRAALEERLRKKRERKVNAGTVDKPVQHRKKRKK